MLFLLNNFLTAIFKDGGEVMQRGNYSKAIFINMEIFSVPKLEFGNQVMKELLYIKSREVRDLSLQKCCFCSNNFLTAIFKGGGETMQRGNYSKAIFINMEIFSVPKLEFGNQVMKELLYIKSREVRDLSLQKRCFCSNNFLTAIFKGGREVKNIITNKCNSFICRVPYRRLCKVQII